MKIDRKRIANKCGCDQVECSLLAKRLAVLPDDQFIEELRKVKVWNYGKCELGLWADVLDRLDAILEDATTKQGSWKLKVDLPGNEYLADKVIAVLDFTSHLIEHSIYRCLYGSWTHILTLFSTSNMDVLLAVLGLAYNFSKRSNYFSRFDPFHRSYILERLRSIAESWGGTESQLDLASCCRPDHNPPNAGRLKFTYYPSSDAPVPVEFDEDYSNYNGSPSDVMEEILSNHAIPVERQTAIFARLRVAVYFSNHQNRLKCIKARLQATSALCYTPNFDSRLIYPGLVDEMIQVVLLPEGEFTSIKACALRTLTAIFNLQRLNVNLENVMESPIMLDFHSNLPTLIKRWIQGMLDGTIDASSGSVNQQYTISLLSFIYHLAAFEQSLDRGFVVNHAHTTRTMSSPLVLDAMLQLISWTVPDNDYLSYITRAVRVTDQILNSATNRLAVLDRLIDRLDYEADLVINPPQVLLDEEEPQGDSAVPPVGVLNTQRSGLMKSILNLLKRISVEPEWNDSVQVVILGPSDSSRPGSLPEVLKKIYSHRKFHAAPNLVILSIEILTSYIYAFPSSLSQLQDKGVTTDILSALTTKPFPQSREFLIQLPSILRTLALNQRGRSALCSSGVFERYVGTLVRPDYLPVMRVKKTLQSSGSSASPTSHSGLLGSSLTGITSNNNCTPYQMASFLNELLRQPDIRGIVYSAVFNCFERVVNLCNCPAEFPYTPAQSFYTGSASDAADQPTGSGVPPAETSQRRIEHPEGGDRHTSSEEEEEEEEGETSVVNVFEVVDESADLSTEEEEDDDDDNHREGHGGVEHVHLIAEGEVVEVEDEEGAAVEDAIDEDDEDAAIQAENERHLTEILQDSDEQEEWPRPVPMTIDDSLVPDHPQNIPEYIFNLCKFVERMQVTIYPNHQGHIRDLLHSADFVRLLLRLLRQPGLPFDFPVSAACSCFCKVLEGLIAHMPVTSYIQILLSTLRSVIDDAKEFWLNFPNRGPLTSVVLDELKSGHTNGYLHDLVRLASAICVLVQVMSRLSSEAILPFVRAWNEEDFLFSLKDIYHDMVMEASWLLSCLRDAAKAKESATTISTTTASTSDAAVPVVSVNVGGYGDTAVDAGVSILAANLALYPPFVQTLSAYTLCPPRHTNDTVASDEHQALYLTAYVINSVNELTTCLTRLSCSIPLDSASSNAATAGGGGGGGGGSTSGSNVPSLNYAARFSAQRVMDMLNVFGVPAQAMLPDTNNTNSTDVDREASNQPEESTTTASEATPPLQSTRRQDALPAQPSAKEVRERLLTRVALFLSENLIWRPLDPTFDYRSPLMYALRYSAFQLTHLVVFGSASFYAPPSSAVSSARGINLPLQSQLMAIGGVQFFVDSFIELLEESSNSESVDTAVVARVIDSWLACAERLLDFSAVRAEARTLADLEGFVFDVEQHCTRLAHWFLIPLRKLCEKGYLKNLSRKGVEHLLKIIKNLAPTIYSQEETSSSASTSQAPQTSNASSTSSGVTEQWRTDIERRAHCVPMEDSPRPSDHCRFFREHLFHFCLEVARVHFTEDTLNQVIEVVLAGKDEVNCIHKLVSMVTAQRPSGDAALPADSGVPLYLQLLCLFFSNRRFDCVWAFTKEGLVPLLEDVLMERLWVKAAPPEVRHQLLALCASLLELYLRTTGALALRVHAVKAYGCCHAWRVFDTSNRRWNSITAPEADEAFHNGVFRVEVANSSGGRSRGSQVFELGAMTQCVREGSSSMPLMLFPFSEDEKDLNMSCTSHTAYEKEIQERYKTIYKVSGATQASICQNIVKAFRSTALDARCTNSFLRLLLRLLMVNSDNVKVALEAGFFDALFNFQAPPEVMDQFTSYLGFLLRAVFLDKTTLKAIMDMVSVQFLKGASPVLHWGCRDLFYTLQVLAPLMVHDSNIAIDSMMAFAGIQIKEKSLKEGKPALGEYNLTMDPDHDLSQRLELTEDQKRLVINLINRLLSVVEPAETAELSVKKAQSGSLKSLNYLVYITDLLRLHPGLADFLATHQVSPNTTFLSHLFVEEMRHEAHTHVVHQIVSTILFYASPASQKALIGEFKASLRQMFTAYPADEGSLTLAQHVELNQRIAAHVQLLREMLLLPHPLQAGVVRGVFKRRIPADMAKLVSLVHCAAENHEAVLTALVKCLDELACIDKQVHRLMHDLKMRQNRQGDGENHHVSVVTTVADDAQSAAETAQPVASSLAPSIVTSSEFVHPPVSAGGAATASASRQQVVTEEGDTWAMAEDAATAASEMEDTTVDEDEDDEEDDDDDDDDRRDDTGAMDTSFGGEEEEDEEDDDDDDDEDVDESGYADEHRQEGERNDDGVIEGHQQHEGREEGELMDNDDEEEDDDDDEDGDDGDGHHHRHHHHHPLIAVTAEVAHEEGEGESARNSADGGSQHQQSQQAQQQHHRHQNHLTQHQAPHQHHHALFRRGSFLDNSLILHLTSLGAGGGGSVNVDEISDWGLTTEAWYDLAGREILNFATGGGGPGYLPDSALLDVAFGGGGGTAAPPAGAPGSASATLVNAFRQPIIGLPVRDPLFTPTTTATATTTTTTTATAAVPSSATTLPVVTSVALQPLAQVFPSMVGELSGSGNLRALRTQLLSHRLPPQIVSLLSQGTARGFSRLGSASVGSRQTPIIVRTNLGSGVISQAGHQATAAGGGGIPMIMYDQPTPRRRPVRRRYAPQSATSNTTGFSSSATASARAIFDNRSEPRVESAALEMLEDLGNSASFTVAEILHLASDGVSGFVPSTPANASLVFRTLFAYRHFVELAYLMGGQEMMDMILIARQLVGAKALAQRNSEFEERLKEFRKKEEKERPEKRPRQSADAAPPESASASDVDTSAQQEPVFPPPAEEAVTPAPPEAQPATTEAAGPSTTEAPAGGEPSAPAPAPVRMPETDDEIIASMVSEGVDLTFLEALPEEMCRELMNEHLRTLRSRVQLSNIRGNLPEHVDPEFLASLPLNLQEEVLAQVQQANQPPATGDGAAAAAATGGGAEGEGGGGHDASFLRNLAAPLRREIFADMEDFQVDLLPPDMQNEARDVRRTMMMNRAHMDAGSANNPMGHRPPRETTRIPSSRIFPTFFGALPPVNNPPMVEPFHWRLRGRHYNGTQRQGHGILPPTTLNALQANLSAFSDKASLSEPEGLACLIGLIICCGVCPSLRHLAYDSIKQLLLNVCAHKPSRQWVLSTLVHVLEHLSDTPVPVLMPHAANMSDSRLVNNSIFCVNFEQSVGGENAAPAPFYTRAIQSMSAEGGGPYVINPVAAPNTAFIFLDIIDELARTYSADMYPQLLQEGEENTTEEGEDIKTEFWDIVALYCQRPPPAMRGGKPVLKSCYQQQGGRQQTASRSQSEQRHSVDYFSRLTRLLKHPVVSQKPVIQEKLLHILLRAVHDFIWVSNKYETNRRGHGPYFITPVGGVQTEQQESQQAETVRVNPLSRQVMQCLCDIIMARDSTEQCRGLATWLIALMSGTESASEAFFQRLGAAATSLAASIEKQLDAIVAEVNALSPNSRLRQRQRQQARKASESASALQHSSSMIRLSAQPLPSTSSSAPPQPSHEDVDTDTRLQLSSLKPLLSLKSEQSRLCRILRLMVHLSSNKKLSIEEHCSLTSLWNSFSSTLTVLEDVGDAKTETLFQPLMESLCLAHAKSALSTSCLRPPFTPIPSRSGRSSASLLNWTDFQLPSRLASTILDVHNIIVFNNFPEFHSPDAAPRPTMDFARPMSPPTPGVSEASSASTHQEQQQTETSSLVAFVARHRSLVNQMMRSYTGNLSESAYMVLLSAPKYLDFDVKRRFFRQRFQSLSERSQMTSRGDEESIVVSRNRIFEDSFSRLYSRSPERWKHRFIIRFRNEEGQDAGGLLREWYLLMSREIFNPNYCLFKLSPSDRVTYTINPASYVNSNHLDYFNFVGRFIAKAIYDNKLLECYFTRSFYKHILGRRVKFSDLESEDYDFYKGLAYLLNNNVSNLTYEVTFSTEINEFGKTETRELIENGSSVVVTEANKNEYVRLVCQERMTGAIRKQLNAFLEGFYSIIPKNLINIFNEQELELLISGLPTIDINDLKANTTYSKYTANSPQIEWFWRALESFEHEDRARFIQFVTGTSRVPLGGFANLEGMHGPTKFQICRAGVLSTNHLPSAHTCFNTMELPPYENYEKLRERLLTAIRECSEGYGMA